MSVISKTLILDLTAEVNRAGEMQMGDESTTPLVMESITAPKAVIPVHQARSHDELNDEFRSPDLNFTVWSPTALSSCDSNQ